MLPPWRFWGLRSDRDLGFSLARVRVTFWEKCPLCPYSTVCAGQGRDTLLKNLSLKVSCGRKVSLRHRDTFRRHRDTFRLWISWSFAVPPIVVEAGVDEADADVESAAVRLMTSVSVRRRSSRFNAIADSSVTPLARHHSL